MLHSYGLFTYIWIEFMALNWKKSYRLIYSTPIEQPVSLYK